MWLRHDKWPGKDRTVLFLPVLKTAESLGSMLEISWNGEKPIKLSDGTHRAFIEDGDTVIMSGVCESNGIRVGFGECVCPVEASLPM